MRPKISIFFLISSTIFHCLSSFDPVWAEIEDPSVLTRFGSLKPSAALNSKSWYQLDQKARKSLSEGDTSQAEQFWKDACAAAEASNNVYPGVVNCLIGISRLYHDKNNFGESDRVYELAMRNMEGLVGRSAPEYAKQLPDLAWLYLKHNKPDKAEYILKQAVKTNETAYGFKSVQCMESLREYANFLNNQNRSNEASLLELQIKKIEEHINESNNNTQSDIQIDQASPNDGN
ncbi:MAG: tetratricopeptide repeat protein [Candidatus Melainabacteria bacterium]|nr:tetratricopeptide repeat protein [Candidatus Melainabacteria bacterium]